MFCSKCGNELRDNDEFCSKCGTKVTREIHNTSQSKQPAQSSSNSKLESVKKFFKYLIVFFLIVILQYMITLPKNVSIIDFVIDPNGLRAIGGFAMGAGLALLVFFLPLLNGLKKLNVMSKMYKMEFLFIFSFLYGFFYWLFGRIVFEESIKPLLEKVMGLVFIIGIILSIIAYFKNKKTK